MLGFGFGCKLMILNDPISISYPGMFTLLFTCASVRSVLATLCFINACDCSVSSRVTNVLKRGVYIIKSMHFSRYTNRSAYIGAAQVSSMAGAEG